MVTVSSATSSGPTVFPLIQCGSGTGNTVTLGCIATGYSPSSLTYTWTKNGAALTDFIQYPSVQKGSTYMGVSQIQVPRQDWEAKETFKCVATHAEGNAHGVFTPTTGPTNGPTLPTVSVFSSSGGKDEVSFSCLAKDFAPKEHKITWLKDEVEISNKLYEFKTTPEGRQTENGTMYSVSSFLTVSSTELTSGMTITCLFKGKNKNGDAYVNSTVTYKDSNPCPSYSQAVDVKITGPEMEDIFLNHKGTLVCQVKADRPSIEKIFWEDEGGNEMAGSSFSPPSGNKGPFSVPLDITYDEWSNGVKRICVVEHSEVVDRIRKTYQRVIGGNPQRPSVFMFPPVEHTKKEMVTLTCYVKDFFPQDILVSWLVDDEEADSKYQFHTTNPVENRGTYSAYGQLSLSLEQWKKNDVVYSCSVHHESVSNKTKAIVRSIGYRTSEQTNLVNLNMKIPETCKPQ